MTLGYHCVLVCWILTLWFLLPSFVIGRLFVDLTLIHRIFINLSFVDSFSVLVLSPGLFRHFSENDSSVSHF
jgi:uncharacterized membrane protein